MEDFEETLKPGSHVEVLTKQQVDGQKLCGSIIGAAANNPGTYIVEYHPGLDNGHHSRNELKPIGEFPCSKVS